MREQLRQVVFMNLLAEGMGRCWWGSDRVSPSQTPDFNANVPSFMGNIGNGEEVEYILTRTSSRRQGSVEER
jgi:hypothetical protein